MDDKQKYINSLRESLTYSNTKFDTQTLTISGASLAFSLTFIKEIVPFREAVFILFFYISLALFVVTIFLGLYGHYLSMKKISKAIDLAEKEKYKEINEQSDDISKINRGLLICIVGGVIFLIIYCILNIENQRRLMNSKDSKIKPQIDLIDKKDTISIKNIIKLNNKDSLNNKSIIKKDE